MKNYLFSGILILLTAVFVKAQENKAKELHDKVTEMAASVLFDTKTKSIRDQIKAFENSNGTKLQFRVENQSLDKLGGLSEHLFKLFQNFTSSENVNAGVITGEFSALEKDSLSASMSYKTNATIDLSTCKLPLKDTRQKDSLYSASLQKSFLTSEYVSEVPKSIDEIYPQAIYDYNKILYDHSDCADPFNSGSYNEHVFQTKQIRANKWLSDIEKISLNLSSQFGLITSSNSNTVSPKNAGSTQVNLFINENAISGNYIVDLGNCYNECTLKDLDVRCRMLRNKTGIYFLFLTCELDYFIPTDSNDTFLNAAVQTFSLNYTDDVIVALYLKMNDGNTNYASNVLIKQINGTWLTQADLNFAKYNNGGTYKGGAVSRFNNVFKNIPKPLILCYQVAKVNGMLSTAYFNKSNEAKGHTQIYTHVFKIDKAFDELKELYNQLDNLTAITGGGSGSIIGTGGNASFQNAQEISRVTNKIKICYIKSLHHPQFKDSEETFKEQYLQQKEIVENAALRYLKDKYGSTFKNNQLESLTATFQQPTDLISGTCKSEENSDDIASLLDASSLVLSPTGLDFIPDALSVVYYLSNEQYTNAAWASSAFVMPGLIQGAKKVVVSVADAVHEMWKGSKLIKESGQLTAISSDANLVAGLFKINPSTIDPNLVSKINDNPGSVNQLLVQNEEQAKLFSNVSESLEPAKRAEFVQKSIDDPNWRQKVLDDPDEVLRWAGVVENIRGVSKTDFINSVSEFAIKPDLIEDAWAHFKNENWSKLEEIFSKNNINGGWPPNRGFIQKSIIELPVDFEFDRFGGEIINGKLVDNGSFVGPLNLAFEKRALPQTFLSKPYTKYKVIKNIPGVGKGEAIPWFGQKGLGTQYELPQNFGIDFLLENGYIQKIN